MLTVLAVKGIVQSIRVGEDLLLLDLCLFALQRIVLAVDALSRHVLNNDFHCNPE